MANFNLPDRVSDPDIDDISGVDVSIDELYKTFVIPIENVRSFSAPASNRQMSKDRCSAVSDVANTADTSVTFPKESRAHAFYRMIGFPVVGDNLSFYNPGIDPTLGIDGKDKRHNIARSTPYAVQVAHVKREQSVRARYSVFSRATIEPCIYGIVMGVPNCTKPILNMNSSDSFNSLETFDPQIFALKSRRDYIEKNYKMSSGEEIKNFSTGSAEDYFSNENFFETGSHILRPFVVDQNIVDSISGHVNETRHVSAPFLLKKEDSLIERDIYAKRPGIEFVLRLRLKASKLTATNIGREITDDARSTITALEFDPTRASQVSDADIAERLKKINDIEYQNIRKLVKTIKGVVRVLVECIDGIGLVSKQISWAPVPNERGPEYGSSQTDMIVGKNTTPLDYKIFELMINEAMSSKMGSISDDETILPSDFHLSILENTEIDWKEEINYLESVRQGIEQEGMQYLSVIEMILGEISGLGIIDILSIYTSLWAVDIKVLLSMIDEVSFKRLYENVDLRTPEVEEREASGSPHMNIQEALTTFERQVINILSYTDKIYNQLLGSSANEEGGDVPRVNI